MATDLFNQLGIALESLRNKGHDQKWRASGSALRADNRIVDGETFLIFCAARLLELSNHPLLIERAKMS